MGTLGATTAEPVPAGVGSRARGLLMNEENEERMDNALADEATRQAGQTRGAV